MAVHMGSGLVMTNATTVEAHGICWIWGKALRNATITNGQPATAAMAATPLTHFFSRSQSMPCQTMHSSIRS